MNDNLFPKDINILSSEIYKIDIYKVNDDLYIEIYFNIVYPTQKQIKLKFSKVKEFLLFWNSENIFYNVESYKLFKINNYIYLSLDPFDESNSISEKDQDYILCENMLVVFPL